MELITNFMLLFTESAPYLLVGLLLAGIIQFIIPARWIDTTLGEHSSVVTAALIGTPLPLCSCSVIPAAMGIRRAGASKASTASFMVATPETGVDSIGVTLALMGPAMAVFRPIAAIFSAIMAGKMVRWWDVETPPRQETTQKSCCSATKSPQKQSYWNMVKAIFQYGYGKLLADFMTWLLIGISFAALIQTYVPQTFLAAYGNGIPAMILVVLISTPMYICATASTPVAAGLMLSGISPGAAYQGLGDGIDKDVEGVRYLSEQVEEMLIATSCSKNFGLYRERTGSLLVQTKSSSRADAILTQIKEAARSSYSMSPAYGGFLVDLVLNTEELRNEWETELDTMANRVKSLRSGLREKLEQRNIDKDFSFLTEQKGMFSFLGISKEQVHQLRNDFAIYMADSSRINVAGLNTHCLDYVADAMETVLK